ncbi:non-ribosomal peptide synthetase [Halonatronum saccharophilum]|uniref:non-ribosomal peptide synthetase n=1 Tax=Halonatronum saccharophilum TaxID=150060 RepID=UPI00048264B6|nr:non-ribosomal peptide synthetase [Halonatronum saccharophilum]
MDQSERILDNERDRLIYEFNNTATCFPKNKTLQEIFEKQVFKHRDEIAVKLEDQELTYSQLNERANQLARSLREKGVKVGQVVGLMVERSLDMMVGIWAIIKSGATYLPIEPNYPRERIEYMLEDSKAKVILGHINLINKLEYGGKIIDITEKNLYKGDKANLENLNSPNDIVYIIYTSGTTGRPKGILTTHYNISRVVKNTNYININSNDRILQLSNYAFDGSTFDIYGAFLNGAKLVMITQDKLLEVDKLAKLIKREKITIFFVTTALFNILADNHLKQLKGVRKILFGGERISVPHARKALDYLGKDKLIHVYGPTETTVYATYYYINEIDKEADNIPIGSPIANTEVYILDENNKSQPIGVPGELCIAGDGLAKGYLNRPEKTAEVFVDNTFSEGKMYRTGDLVKMLDDGNIEFIGRIDHQVKIRGFRIELGEIQSKLLEYFAIKEAIIIAKGEKGSVDYLCAYITGNRDLTVAELRKFLSKDLPDYMVPSYFIQLDKMPLTQNGKIDRNKLPEPDGTLNTGVKYLAPESEIEKKLIRICESILRVKKIGMNDDLLALGGDSLKLISLANKIYKEMSIKVSLKEIIARTKLKELVEYLENTEINSTFAIDDVEKRDYYPLSSAQERIMLETEFDQSSTSYNEPFGILIEGKVDINKLELIFKKLIKRHESLRTGFEVINGEFVQKIYQEVPFEIKYMEKAESEIDNILEELGKVFDLSNPPLLRVNLVKVGEDKYYLLIVLHHIIMDGASLDIMVEEMKKLYEGDELLALNKTYKDYAVWQREQLSNAEVIEKQKKYWLDEFSGQLPVLNLPTDYSRPKFKSYNGENITFYLDKETSDKLNRLVSDNNTTLYMGLFAAYNTLLHKYTGQEDIIIGSPMFGRPHIDLENIFGMFVNTIALRSYPEGDKSFEDFLKEAKEKVLQAYENLDYQLADLVDNLDIKRDTSRHPLFDVAFVLQNINLDKVRFGDLEVTPIDFRYNNAKADILLEAIETDKGIKFDLQYCTDLFKKETIERFSKHFINIIKEVVEKPEIKLSEIEMISKDEEEELLIEFNDTSVEYPKEKTIHQIFEEQVEKRTNDIAIIFEGQELTYEELNQKANQLARLLRKSGVKADDLVGIMLEESLEMIISIIAVIKAGGAYVPIDPNYPRDRIDYILKDSKMDILLTSSNLINEVEFTKNKICVDDKDIYQGDNNNLENINKPSDLAYIIYTSGTTGKPKGVMVEHKNVVRLLFNEKFQFDFNSSDTWTMFHSYCFDFSVWEMYGALLYGAKLILIPKTLARNTNKFRRLLQEYQVTVLNQTPSAFYNLISEELICGDERLNLKYIIFGGEALNPFKLKEWKEKYPETKLINMYGITETTVHVTFKEITIREIESGVSNIGKAIPTLTTYIMNSNMKLQPVGVPGELCVGGEGVTRGYLNREELTEDKFVVNPYKPEERLYRSGDLARLLSNGDMEYLGRIDHQVKIRGFRIELGEIESALLKHQKVKEVVVLAKEFASGDKRLVSYIVTNKESKLNVKEIRSYLYKKIPAYMIPSYFIQLDEMPLNHNGKVDRKSLPEPNLEVDIGVEYVGPRTELESKLVDIWKKILKSDKIGIKDNFLDLGGSSLSVIQMMQMIQLECQVLIPIGEIYSTPTIEELADKIEQIKAKGLEEVMSALGEVAAYSEESSDDILIEEYNLADFSRLSVTRLKPENILLAGSTGFLGSHILRDLIIETDATIYCLLRENNNNNCELRLKKRLNFYFGEKLDKYLGNRIIGVKGDLTEDNLGIEDNLYQELANKVDTVINSAADVRHYGKYEQFENINVFGTQRLVDFCLTSKEKTFHHTSTISIVGEGGRKGKFKESDYNIGQNFMTDVYSKSKFEAERVVYKARIRGLKASIYRIGLLVGRHQDGHFQENIVENRFYNNTKGLICLSKAPSAYMDYKSDFTAVDKCSEAMVSLILWKESIGYNFHMMNANLIPMRKFIAGINKAGYLIEEVSNQEFYDLISNRIKNFDFERELSTLFNDLAAGVHNFIEENTQEKMDTEFTVKALERVGFVWPEIDLEFIKRILKYCNEIGYIN